MKKIIALLLVLTLSLGLLAGCNNQNTNSSAAAPTLEEAMDFLIASCSLDEGKSTPADYKLIAQVAVRGVTFDVAWTASLEILTISKTEDGKYYVVDVPSKNETEVEYTLTATVRDAAGNTDTHSFKRVLPVYDDGAAVSNPEEGVAYKMFFNQANLGKTLFCRAESSSGKFIKTTVNPTEAADFYAEKVDGGYKFYTMVGGNKMYLDAHTTMDDGKVSKYLDIVAETEAVFFYKTDVKTWFVTIDSVDYGVGTYNTFDTMSLSEGTYFTAEKVGVSQFVMALITKEAAEAMTPTEGPADPTELTTITRFNEIANGFEQDKGSQEKYLVKGTITEIKNTTYGNVYIQDAEGNSLYIYGLYNKDGSVRFDAMENQPKVGDTITVMGVAWNYNGAQMKNGWITEHIAGEGGDSTEQPEKPTPGNDPAADSELSVKDAIALGTAKEHDTYTAGKYYVTGEITEIYNTQYGNMRIKDAEGNILTIYGTYSADGADRFDAMANKPAVGDTVKIYGIIGQYNGTAQIKNGWIVEQTAGAGGSTEKPDPNPEKPAPAGDLKDVTELKENTEYYIESVMSEGSVYFGGAVAEGAAVGRLTGSKNAAEAKAIKLEAGENAGEYYIYFDNNGTKTYISGATKATAGFALVTEKDATCVFIIDVAAKTILNKEINRGFATQVNSTYTTISFYSTTNLESAEYDWCWLMEKA